jgi:hypothetical protein
MEYTTIYYYYYYYTTTMGETAAQTKSFISVNARNVKMAQSTGRSNGVADSSSSSSDEKELLRNSKSWSSTCQK